jgi:predicted amidophosphoribosyltransferase
MDVKQCRFCRKPFRGFSALCPVCAEQLDEKYVTVRNYLDKYPGGNISMVAEESGVDERSLLFLMREGRLSLKSDSAFITCMKCGTAIQSGRYCEKCKGDLVRTLESTRNSMASSIKPSQPKPKNTGDDKGKMHVLMDD